MSEHDVDKLLGGFAADTLTPEERRKLYQAALEDQQVFNALAEEQALKELLTDPAVRRRLLGTLGQRDASAEGGSRSWLEWFRRPAGLAFAGGLAVALFALVFGTRIFEESLRQSEQSAVTEEAKPVLPPAQPPAVSGPTPSPDRKSAPARKEDVAAPKEPARQEVLRDRLAKREKATAPPPLKKEEPAPVTQGKLKEQPDRDTARSSRDTTAPSSEVAANQTATVPPRRPGSGAAPPAPAIAPAPMQVPANPPAAGAAAPSVSARALFYGAQVAGGNLSALSAEGESRERALADAPQGGRFESKSERFFGTGKSAEKPPQLLPLGIRYSFVKIESDGRAHEIEATAVGREPGQIRLTVEANQTAYVQVWRTVGNATPHLLLPDKETGKISLKLTAGRREQVALPTETEPLTLTIRLSRTPFGPITRQEAVLLGRLSPDQLSETVTPTPPAGPHEQATYVVSRDPSPTAQIAVAIPLGR